MSGASSLRNAVKRITHKERAQPIDRKKLGLLEKHKDYVERSKDYKKKQKYLHSLRNKANERNPDEFYFKMHNSQMKNGKHQEKSQTERKFDKETIDLLKTQDLAYILHKKALDDRKIEKLAQGVQLIGDVQPRKHIIFIEGDDAALRDFDPATHFDTPAPLLDCNYNRLKTSQLLEMEEVKAAKPPKDKRDRDEEVAELSLRLKRSKKLKSAFEELSLQRQLSSSKGSKQKLVVTKEVGRERKEKEVVLFKWKRQRLR